MKRTPLKPGKPLQRRTALRSGGSLKRTGTTRSRKASASTVIPQNVKNAVDARDARYGQPQCQRCGHLITGWFSRHHRNPRGMGGSKRNPHALVNLVLLCGSATSQGGCHEAVETAARRQAYIDGWLVPDGINPADWPVRRFSQPDYQLPSDNGWTPAEQHPLQAMWEAAA
jgi:hypothetical protein